ncbi:MAG: hypothetical protein HY352_04525 [Candidatus Omnitrophica bacterium]|nr:hypothetical protein [Candidatus Omnitrophota bacterium]
MARATPPWHQWTKTQRLVAGIVLSVAAVWIVYLAVLRPLHRQVVRLRDEVQNAEQRLVEAVAASQQVEKVGKAFAAYQPYVVPAASQELERAGFASEVESALRASGMAVLSLNQVAPREQAPETISVSVEAESSPGQLMQFLSLVQRSTRLLKVTELAVRSSESKTLRSSLVISKLIVK